MFIGDVVGETGPAAVSTLVPVLRRELELAGRRRRQWENSASTGRGITSESASELLSVVDFLTLGNHAFDVKESERFLEWEPRVIRPANLEAGSPGCGWGMFEAGGVRVGVANVQGRVFMKHSPGSPFKAADLAVEELETAGADLVLVDVHAEATSEKQAVGYHLVGKAQAVV